ncbi:MAG TPA: hypothetical protein VH415_12810 [Nitrososphaeraceae archaeon]
MKRVTLTVSLITIFVSLLIVSVSSFSIPDPLHTVNVQFKGTLHEKDEVTIYLSDVQRRKNISLYIISDPEDTILNAKILSPRANLIVDQNLSNNHKIDIAPALDGNYTASIHNLNKDFSNIDIFFASSVLFYPNGTPKYFEINMIKSGVILFILGSLTATFTVIVELVRKYKRRQYHYS